MGLFDIQIKKDIQTQKDEVINYLENKLTPFSKDTTISEKTLFFKGFKPKSSLLTYDLNIDIEKSKKSISLNIFGELLHVWILVILVVTGILFTYGIGVILVIVFVFYQKITATKYLNNLLDNIPKE
ncbi:hypothetical protein [Arcobacter arenosus]|uniref:Uncharacterized protein n=1 Tax=Arcobacter arenosus TaxID=2576037 RepID=A0A5R8Y3N6_9BACT|nr:hypothetical protein [Arcobacter arenosus]TLP39481.1 hypothetical protein FDK22_06315 [Arcobacter arenosus]